MIVGGGTAGWITAGVLAARFPQRGDHGLSITLIESRLQPPIGVGEGTWPTIRSTLQQIGVSETAFLRECDASFKQGTQFNGWADGSPHDVYLHPFTLPAGFVERDLAPYWAESEGEAGFAESLCFQAVPSLKGLAPKTMTTPEYAFVANYAYHLDAGKFAPFLQRHCVQNLGVEHVLDDIVEVQADASGDIARLLTKSGRQLAGDLFIDCSGFASLLIGRHYNVPFVPQNEVLFVDRAWAVQVPYRDAQQAIASTTHSTARSAGWIWDIGLTSRRGVGYVYSSRHQSDDSAQAELKGYLASDGDASESLSYRKIDIRSGYRQSFWVRNCVAVGLSAGFLEPLEASAIVMAELSAKAIANLLPGSRGGLAHAARIFNDTFRYRWERIVDFLKLHYVLSRRTEPFWVDNRLPASVPESLRAGLDYWRGHSPWHDDFLQREEVFSAASYQYVLHGMGFHSEQTPWLLSEPGRELWRERSAETARQAQALSSSLLTNRQLLNRIHRYGLQKI